MNKWKIFFIALLAIALTPFSAPASAGQHGQTLSNGLQVFALENLGTASVSLDLFIKTGSRNEPAKLNGISHLLEHLLFQGTAKRTAKDISQAIAAVGGSMNAFTFWEYTQVHIALLPQDLPLGLDILADIAQNSLLSEDMIAKERKVVLEEISLENIFPPTHILNLVSKTLFPDYPLRFPIAGTRKTVNSITREDLQKYYETFYIPNNCILTIVGSLELEKACAIAEEKFGKWARKELSPLSIGDPPQQKRTQEIQERKFLDRAIIIVAVQAMGLKDADRPAFEVINAVLGSGACSRLYQEIREKRALSYLVGSIYHPLSNTGLWATYAGTDPKNLVEVRKIMFDEIRKIREQSLMPQELEEFKNYISGQTLRHTESNPALSEFIAKGLMENTPEMPAEHLQKLRAVTAQDVLRVARTYLGEDHCNVIIVKPYPGLKLFRGLL